MAIAAELAEEMTMRKMRILLADDHTLLLQACEKMLAPDYDIPAVFTDGRALLKAAPALKPDAIILDISMPLLNGLDAGRELKKLMPNGEADISYDVYGP